MREVMQRLQEAADKGERIALATVVRTEDSAPRMLGTSMVISEGGNATGSVSGGCVEAAVMEAAAEVLATDAPQLHRFGLSNEDVFAVGLTCGGTVDIFIQTYSPADERSFGALQKARSRNLPGAILTVFEGPPTMIGRMQYIPADAAASYFIGDPEQQAWEAVNEAIQPVITLGTSAWLELESIPDCAGAIKVLVDVYAPPRRLLIFGAIDFTSALATLAAGLDYHVTVCDARPVFATKERIPHADEIIVDQPERYLRREIAGGRLSRDTAICVLTHDPKFDIPVLDAALSHGFSYIGAMGSRRTDRDRRDKLTALGHSNEALLTLHSPIGLDLGARSPAETALSIMAEVMAVRESASAQSLNRTNRPIHRQVVSTVQPQPNHIRPSGGSDNTVCRSYGKTEERVSVGTSHRK